MEVNLYQRAKAKSIKNLISREVHMSPRPGWLEIKFRGSYVQNFQLVLVWGCSWLLSLFSLLLVLRSGRRGFFSHCSPLFHQQDSNSNHNAKARLQNIFHSWPR